MTEPIVRSVADAARVLAALGAEVDALEERLAEVVVGDDDMAQLQELQAAVSRRESTVAQVIEAASTVSRDLAAFRLRLDRISEQARLVTGRPVKDPVSEARRALETASVRLKQAARAATQTTGQ